MKIAKLIAEPVVWVIPGDDNANMNGFIDAMCYQHGEFTRPLYAASLANSAEALVDLVKAVRVLMCYPDLRRNIGTDCYDPVADALAALGKEWEE